MSGHAAPNVQMAEIDTRPPPGVPLRTGSVHLFPAAPKSTDAGTRRLVPGPNDESNRAVKHGRMVALAADLGRPRWRVGGNEIKARFVVRDRTTTTRLGVDVATLVRDFGAAYAEPTESVALRRVPESRGFAA